MPQPLVRRQRPLERTSRSPRDSGPISWDYAVDAFLTAKRAANVSSSTLTNYEMHLRGGRARIFLADHKVGSPAHLTDEVLEAFQSELLSAGLSPALTHAYHRVWRNFAGFCIDRGFGTSLSILMVKAPKLPQKEPPIFTEDEIRRLGLAARSSRDRLIIETFLRTGLRLEELCTLDLTDLVDGPEGHFLRVRGGKGAKDRIVPLDTDRVKFSAKLRRYITGERPADTNSPAIFLSQHRKSGLYPRLSPRGVQLMLRRLGEDTGIHVYAHKFRHTFATRALAAGVDVMVLKRVLGHTTLAMVSRYVHYQRSDLLDAWRKRAD